MRASRGREFLMANRISMKPEKPPYGHPVCNGCGRCCQEELCPLASFVFLQIEGPCPALEDVGDRFSCGLVNHPEQYAPFRSAAMGRNALSRAATLMIGVGVGCDGQLESEEGSNPEYRARLESLKPGIKRKVAQALHVWGVG